MKLESKRIEIIPLTLHEMQIFIKSRSDYEKHANLTVTGIETPEFYRDEIKETIQLEPKSWTSKNKEYLFHTIWLMIQRESKTIVGQFVFNGRPNELGEVEIFFMVELPYRKQGIATEAMLEIMRWGCKTKLFRVVYIDADLQNKAAKASLNKLGFKKQPDDEDGNPSNRYYKAIYPTEPCIDDLEVDPIKE
ncbi:MAG: GNAT family N-acetyltransferase [Bacteroidales bacterium]|nr:GNAT family N-acetyltransferase [Bacteroidales bacterium]